MKYKIPAYFSFLILFLINKPSALKSQTVTESNHCVVPKSAYKISMDWGKVVYIKQCSSCHQGDGTGVLKVISP